MIFCSINISFLAIIPFIAIYSGEIILRCNLRVFSMQLKKNSLDWTSFFSPIDEFFLSTIDEFFLSAIDFFFSAIENFFSLDLPSIFSLQLTIIFFLQLTIIFSLQLTIIFSLQLTIIFSLQLTSIFSLQLTSISSLQLTSILFLQLTSFFFSLQLTYFFISACNWRVFPSTIDLSSDFICNSRSILERAIVSCVLCCPERVNWVSPNATVSLVANVTRLPKSCNNRSSERLLLLHKGQPKS